jgi:vacuolar-type H+-ATPase subunit C/Vma6
LLELRAARPGAELFEMEVALDRWYFRAAVQAARRADSVLSESLALEAAATNIMTALRLVGAPEAAAILRERFGSDNAIPLFVGPERIPFALLAQVARQESVPQAIALLAGTAYGAMLSDVIDAYTASSHLSVFERALAQRRLQHAAGLIMRDPLGIGVLLGYVALKTNEVANLRAIAQGLMLAEKPDRIRPELMFA